MKVLTTNVEFKFTCENESCDNEDPETSDVFDLCNSGTIICPSCGSEMVVDQECIIKN